MQRRPHLLEPTKREFRPRYHIFFDIETDVGPYVKEWREHRFRLGWALYWRRGGSDRQDVREWYEIKSPEAFWEWVERHTSSKSRLLLVAHNIEYDSFILGAFRILPERGWELTSWYSGSHVAIYRWRKKGRTIQFVDNANWFKGALAKWGDVAGVPKMDVDPLTADRETLREYCHRDVEILHALWKWYYAFIDEHRLGSWGITLPSQAFLAYRHRFMEHDIYIHNDYDVLRLERESYHGGRVEVFKRGEFTDGPFYKLDVNSMYPWAMWSFEYPISLRGTADYFTIKRLRYALSKYCVVADVTLWCDVPYFPSRHDGRLVYKVGKIRTVLTTPELILALEKGWVEKVHRASWYSKAPIFQGYVDYFYSLKFRYKREGNLVCFELTKLMLNSLYGKFGQRKTNLKALGDCDPWDFSTERVYSLVTGKWGVEYRFGGKAWFSTKGGESYHSFPAIAAHITSYARLQLYRLVESVKRSNCFYIDTDSLIINEEGYKTLLPFIREGELGNLKLEGVATYLAIYAPKDYVLDEEVKIKGVRRDAVWLDDRTVEQEMFPSIRGLMMKGDGNTYRTKKTVKVLKREIKSGAVDDDGRVWPWGSEEAQEVISREPEVFDEQVELEALREQLLWMPSRKTVHRFYNLKLGMFRTVTDPSGRRCEFAQSQTVQETGHILHGFEQSTQGAEEFGELILQTIEVYDRILELEDRLGDAHHLF